MRLLVLGLVVCVLVAAAALLGAQGGGVLASANRTTATGSVAPSSIPATRSALRARFGTPASIANTSEGECWDYGERPKNRSTPAALRVCFRKSGVTSFSYSVSATDEVIGFNVPDNQQHD